MEYTPRWRIQALYRPHFSANRIDSPSPVELNVPRQCMALWNVLPAQSGRCLLSPGRRGGCATLTDAGPRIHHTQCPTSHMAMHLSVEDKNSSRVLLRSLEMLLASCLFWMA